MLEHLVSGWTGKTLVLVLLGFAATDFVITKTLSAADATEHLLKNPWWPKELAGSRAQVIVTMILLVMLGATFLRGFKDVISVAVVIVAIYLVLNSIVVGSSLAYLWNHPEAMNEWYRKVMAGDWHFNNPFSLGTSWWGIAAVSLLLFPKLALGMSGFETGVAVMPLIRGGADDTPEDPRGRVRNTRKLLLTAALIMSLFLLGSALVTSTLIDPRDLQKHPTDPELNGAAFNRALAYIAHGESLVLPGVTAQRINPWFGPVFGTLYDLSTIIILWFAGASAMAGLLNLVPQYLPRYGMAPEWTRAFRPLVILFTLVNLFVTWQFNASVEAQGAAYATGVLVLMSSACLAGVIDIWRRRAGRAWYVRLSWPYALIGAVFFYTTAANVIEKPDGIKIASWFILAIVVSSVISRTARVKELRFMGFHFKDQHSRFLWESMLGLDLPVLVPHRPGTRSLAEKEEIIRREHRLTPDVMVVFIEAELGDPSEFYQQPLMEVIQQEGRFIVRVTRCSSIPHVIAAIALELSRTASPPEIHFGWSNESPVIANLGFLLFGEGNVPWMVRELIREAEPNADKQPRVIVG
jgi:hypothetical protein